MLAKEKIRYANCVGYSDIHPNEIVRYISEKTIEVRAMKAERDPEYKPQFIHGGFLAVCINQEEQRWIIESDKTARIVRIRQHKDGKWRDSSGNRYLLNEKPIKFYDYNF